MISNKLVLFELQNMLAQILEALLMTRKQEKEEDPKNRSIHCNVLFLGNTSVSEDPPHVVYGSELFFLDADSTLESNRT